MGLEKRGVSFAFSFGFVSLFNTHDTRVKISWVRTLGRNPVSQSKILSVLIDGKLLSSSQIGGLTGLPRFALWEALRRC